MGGGKFKEFRKIHRRDTQIPLGENTSGGKR